MLPLSWEAHGRIRKIRKRKRREAVVSVGGRLCTNW